MTTEQPDQTATPEPIAGLTARIAAKKAEPAFQEFAASEQRAIAAMNERLANTDEAGPEDVLADAVALLREAATLYDAREQPESAGLLRRLGRELTPAVSAGVAPATDQGGLAAILREVLSRFRAVDSAGLVDAGEVVGFVGPTVAPQDYQRWCDVVVGNQPATDQTALRDRIADVLADADGWRWAPGFKDLSPTWQDYQTRADAVLAVLPATVDRADDGLATARATNQRLNLRAQKLESELAAYRRAVSQWDVSERGTYVPLRTIAAIAKAAGRDIETPQWLLHYQRVEQAEAAIERVRSVLESEAVVGRSALGYRGLITAALMADAASGPRRVAAEARTTEPDAVQPRRGDEFEAWLKTQRDGFGWQGANDRRLYDALDGVLDRYRLHADTGVPLGEHVCEGRAVGDCDRLETPPADEVQAPVQCTASVLRKPHGPHGWEPQPGMEPVRCPGFCKCDHPATEHSVYGCVDGCACEYMPPPTPPAVGAPQPKED